jgi:hypothetical protein
MLPGDSGPFNHPGRRNKPSRPKARPSPNPTYSRGFTYRPPRNSGGGGSFSGGGFVGGGGGGSVSRPKPPPSLSQWLARDADYQDQQRSFSRALSDFTADYTRKRGKVTGDYQSGVKSMGEQRVKDLQDIMNDFAARGLLQSGLYGQRQSDYEKQYQQNLSDLTRQETSSLSDLDSEKTQFTRQQQLAKETARKEAARRRAETYGI